MFAILVGVTVALYTTDGQQAIPLPAYVQILTSDAQVAAELELANACERIERAMGRVVVVECVVPELVPGDQVIPGGRVLPPAVR